MIDSCEERYLECGNFLLDFEKACNGRLKRGGSGKRLRISRESIRITEDEFCIDMFFTYPRYPKLDFFGLGQIFRRTEQAGFCRVFSNSSYVGIGIHFRNPESYANQIKESAIASSHGRNIESIHLIYEDRTGRERIKVVRGKDEKRFYEGFSTIPIPDDWSAENFGVDIKQYRY